MTLEVLSAFLLFDPGFVFIKCQHEFDIRVANCINTRLEFFKNYHFP